MTVTRVSQHVKARRTEVFRALVDARAVSQWMVPDGMSSQVHAFEAREGGAFRISLTYVEATGSGKTSEQTDTFHGRFVRLVPDEWVEQVVEFETADPTLQGEMRITYHLVDAGDGTDVHGEHHGLPAGVSAADNELGWRMSLAKLAALVEAGS
ncbi:MAG TPA: SRPBCC family protein [Polyangiaceae bacterium]